MSKTPIENLSISEREAKSILAIIRRTAVVWLMRGPLQCHYSGQSFKPVDELNQIDAFIRGDKPTQERA